MTKITTEELGDVRLMTLDEIEAELSRLDVRRRLLIRVRKLIVELGTTALNNGRPREDRD